MFVLVIFLFSRTPKGSPFWRPISIPRIGIGIGIGIGIDIGGLTEGDRKVDEVAHGAARQQDPPKGAE